MELNDLVENASELLSVLKKILIIFVFFFLFFFFLSLNFFYYDGVPIPYFYPNFYHSISLDFFLFIKENLLPKGIILININPFDLLTIDVYSSLSLAFICSYPFIVFFLFQYLSPAIYRKEKKLFIYVSIFGTLLFILGALFAFYIVVPLLFDFVIRFSQVLNVEPTVSVLGFFTFTVKMIIFTGIAFEMPLVIVSLVYLDILKPETLFKNWRYAVVISFFLALLISPGTTGGIIETFIGTTLSLLYFGGAIVGKYIYKRKSK